MVDSLIFIHYVAIILVEIRQLQTIYTIKILRSPDGQSRTYSIGQLSVQRAAVLCLEWYYRDFPVYNPYLENAIHRKSNKVSQSNMSANKYKVYDVDGPLGGPAGGDSLTEQKSKAIFAAAARRRDAGHNERYYEEQEYERRVAKRKSRLLTAAEESFTHIKRLREESGPAIPMDSKEAADAIFPSMARALQKFLRVTRQQPAYTIEMIMEHLARCVNYDMSPKAFLEEFLYPGQVINHPKQTCEEEAWSLVSETFLSRGIDNGTQFVLKKSDISLLCVVKQMPYFNISEKVLESQDRFVLRLNSETSV
ncbi:Vang [Bugula neritina]|uniref:Vang n=1 Tax=Bugula neritina TaxID=10212 RepID=A0A7J7J2V4_BUGNE|nr:Vang [Bugula neritina]